MFVIRSLNHAALIFQSAHGTVVSRETEFNPKVVRWPTGA
jgi:hypothetical protein